MAVALAIKQSGPERLLLRVGLIPILQATPPHRNLEGITIAQMLFVPGKFLMGRGRGAPPETDSFIAKVDGPG